MIEYLDQGYIFGETDSKMDKYDLARRTRKFACRIYKFTEKLPRSMTSNVISQQLLRAACSVASNYRAVIRAKSDRDFCNKLKIVLEEADECHFWLEFIGDVDLDKYGDMGEHAGLVKEANELTAIFAASVKTAVLNQKRKKTPAGRNQNLKSQNLKS